MYESIEEQNKELRDRNNYLRMKLTAAYGGKDGVAYRDLHKQWKGLLVKSVTQQNEIDYLHNELWKTKKKT